MVHKLKGAHKIIKAKDRDGFQSSTKHFSLTHQAIDSFHLYLFQAC